MTAPPPRKKLIEVALPLDAINRESAREKSIRHGHPSTLHLWWARRPLAACRAVLFSSFVDDPSADPHLRNPDGSHDEDVEGERRAHLFNLIEELVKWQNSNDEVIVGAARAEIARAVASRKLELGELTKDQKLTGGITPWDLVVRGKARTKATITKSGTAIEIEPTKLPAEAVNAFLAEHAPPVLDPFCGGGSIPLEAQRLGLRAFGSDLNPVPVLITKALIEIPPKFANQPPVHPDALAAGPGGTAKGKRKGSKGQTTLAGTKWKGAQGLAADIRAYGHWMRDEAEKRIGHLYPKIKVTEAMARDRADLRPYLGQELTVIAWLWARTVSSPNPAAGGAHVPLVRSFWLSMKEGKKAWVEPVLALDGKSYKFEVRVGTPGKHFDPKKGTVIRTGATCLLTGQPMPFEHVRSEAKAGRMGAKLMAIVAEGIRGRVYLSPGPEQEKAAEVAIPENIPDTPIPEQALGFRVQLYGMDKHYKLFTHRQLVALATLSDLAMEARARVLADAQTAGLTLAEGLSEVSGARDGPSHYANAVATYLAEAASKTAAFHCTLAGWRPKEGKSARAFGRQNLAMNWDFAEVNPFANAGGGISELIDSAWKTVGLLPATASGSVMQHDAAAARPGSRIMVSTDPPYYDNVGYADLSDFYYVWLRRSLSAIYPTLFRTLLTPKTEELIATPHRFEGDWDRANQFFESGMGRAFERMREIGQPDFPLTVYYAFKQSETRDEASTDRLGEDGDRSGTASTGWETMLEGLIKAGFAITGTWPMRTESTVGLKMTQNVLASSIVLVCHPRGDAAPMASRREFVTALKRELPVALRDLQSANIAPVDLAQAAIGPGMAAFSRYAKVIEANGDRMGVRAALALINQALDEVLAEQEGDFDADSRWALAWFEQHGFDDGDYGVAETLSKAKNTSVKGLVEAGILASARGQVRLLKPNELQDDWDPATDTRLTAWEMVHHMVRAIESGGGEQAAAALAAKLGGNAETARELCYRLYTICERKKRAHEATSYNGLVQSWPEIARLAREEHHVPQHDADLFENMES